jgi:DNA mismatch endonuclease, patch repair protein
MTRWPGNAEREKTTFGDLSRGELMSRIRGKGNKTTETRLAALLRKAEIVGWRRHPPLVGHPDFAWRAVKLVVFVDGCFWHGHDCGKNLVPRTNTQAWRDKIQRNKARDRRVSAQLRKSGWKVLRVWECQLKKDPRTCISRIRKATSK